jgi:hypothetical protein
MATNLGNEYLPRPQTLNTRAQTGGRTMKRRSMIHNITGTTGRGAFLKDWSKQQPGYHDRTVMLKNCGKKCFLGPNKSFPICTRNTCKRNRKGVYAAYIRAEEYKTLRNQDKYRRISAKARRMLRKKKFLHY